MGTQDAIEEPRMHGAAPHPSLERHTPEVRAAVALERCADAAESIVELLKELRQVIDRKLSIGGFFRHS